eukprot:TRINITY_DN13531_c0_g1_i1.p1 TRINITY_DN13531_c0_g1~~TRINITY_DN13531_c0_g1_i1.p1  ORF type:complete len:1772 (-),score=428.68 TRINITY_DN13531_c0_g1_i1:19-5334(-)
MEHDENIQFEVFVVPHERGKWPARVVPQNSNAFKKARPLNSKPKGTNVQLLQVFGKGWQLWHDISLLRQADDAFLQKMTKLDPPQADLKQSYIDALQWYQEMHAVEQEDDDDEPEPLYEVEEVLDSKTVQGGKLYFIKWKGYSSAENTWEPEKNLNPALVVEFHQRQALKEAEKRKTSKPAAPRQSRSRSAVSDEESVRSSRGKRKAADQDDEAEEDGDDRDSPSAARKRRKTHSPPEDEVSELDETGYVEEEPNNRDEKSSAKRKRADSEAEVLVLSDDEEDGEPAPVAPPRKRGRVTQTKLTSSATISSSRSTRSMPARRAASQATFSSGHDILSKILPPDEDEDEDDEEDDFRRSSRKQKGSRRSARGNADFEPDDDAADASDDEPEVLEISDDEDGDGAYRDGPTRGVKRSAPLPERTRSTRTQKKTNYFDIENRDIPVPPSESSSSSEEEESSHEEVADNTGYKLTAEEKNTCITCKTFVPKSKRARCSNCKRAQHLRCCKQKSPNNPKFVCQYCTSYQCDVCNKLEEDPKMRKDMVQCSKCVARYHPACYFPSGHAPDTTGRTWFCTECVEEDSKVVDQVLFRKESRDEHHRNSAKFYVKWKDLSHLHNSWIWERRLKRISPAKYKNFMNKWEQKDLEELQQDEQRFAEWEKCERIVAQDKLRDGTRRYYIKWQDLEYKECTWEDAALVKEKFPEKVRLYKKHKNLMRQRAALDSNTEVTDRSVDSFIPFKRQPDYLPHPLYGYQLEGLNWLRCNWYQRTHCILGDEMGLGKTVQAVSLILSLREEGEVKKNPFMVVAPLSTITNWQREFSRWAPDLDIVSYTGSAESRDIIQKYEFFRDYHDDDDIDDVDEDVSGSEVDMNVRKKLKQKSRRGERVVKFDVLLMSYEMVAKETAPLRKLDWALLIVDEGHRLKSETANLYQNLQLFHFDFRVLLTGTPLQNNLKELFNLLQFVDPEKYNTSELELKFASIGAQGKKEEKDETKDEDAKKESDSHDSDEKSDEESKRPSAEPQVKELHELLRPRILRRLKEETLKDMLPNKVSLVVPVGMSKLQKEMYRELMTRSYTILQGAGAKKAQMNLLMQLQKCCNHPYLFENTEPVDQNLSPAEVQKLLIEASGKLVLLDKMLTKLKAGGHRVLIFSHMTSLLDILEDYVRHNKWGFCRLDGQTSPTERQLLIDRFNTKQDEYFVFLLSTLAGGLGINLATADTVILFDSDWNPHNDLQALSRCHRIGQKSKVMIYRFVTRNSVEEGIVHTAQKKLGLETIVVRSMGRGVDPKTLKAILGHGVAKLFSENSNENDIVYDDAAVEKLLDRNQQEVSPDAAHAPEGASEALKQYLGAFTVAKVWNDDSDVRIEEDVETEGLDWQTIIKERHSRWQRRKEQDLGRGKRRATRNSAPEVKKSAILVSDGSSDSGDDGDFAAADAAEDDDYEDDEDGEESQPKAKAAESMPKYTPNQAMERSRTQLPDGAKAAAQAAILNRAATKHFSGVAGIHNLSREVSQAQARALQVTNVASAMFRPGAAVAALTPAHVHESFHHQIALLQQIQQQRLQAAMAGYMAQAPVPAPVQAPVQAPPAHVVAPGSNVAFSNGPSAERTKFVNNVEGFLTAQYRPNPETYIRPSPPGTFPPSQPTASAPNLASAPARASSSTSQGDAQEKRPPIPDSVLVWLKSKSSDPLQWGALLQSRPDLMRLIKPPSAQAPVAVITIDDDDEPPAASAAPPAPPVAVKPPSGAPVKSVVPIQAAPAKQSAPMKPFAPPASLRNN